MHKLDISQRSPDWVALRKSKIGSSDAPVIAGVSPYKTPYQLWEEKLLDKRQQVTPAMQRGIDLEPIARQKYECLTGYLCTPCVVLHPTIDWKIASLDGLDIDEKHLIEIKCANSEDHAIAKQGKVPEKYIPQLQHQLDVCELDEAHYVSFSGEDLVIVIVKRDQLFINRLNEKEEDFYESLQTLSPPALTNRDVQERDDGDWRSMASSWKELIEQQNKIEEEIKRLREQIIKSAGGKSCEGFGLKISPFIKKGTIDYGSIPEIQNLDLEIYRKAPIENWRITIKK